jgi:hypothetical protein
MPADVFVSHSVKDESVTADLVYALEEVGINCWLAPRDLSAGADWEQAVLDAIAQAKVFILILSPSSTESAQIRNELAAAESSRKKLIVFETERTVSPEAFNYFLRGAVMLPHGPHEPRTAISDVVAAAQMALAENNTGRPTAADKLESTYTADFLNEVMEVNRDEELEQIHSTLAHKKLMVIQGMHGSGKTMLAHMYRKRYENYYTNTWHIYANTKKQLLSNLAQIAWELSVFPATVEDSDPDMNAAKAVLKWLSAQSDNYLIVYDESAGPEDILEFLPKGNTSTLLISSVSSWRQEADILALKGLNLTEAIAFLLRRTGRHDEEGAAALAEAVDRTPRLLAIAARETERLGLSFGEYAKIARSQMLAMSLDPLPKQGAGPHFAIAPSGKIAQASRSTIDAAGNDTRRITQLVVLVRQATDDLALTLRGSSNTFPELVRDLDAYRHAISYEVSDIAWGLVWGLGVRLEEAAAAAERKIDDRLSPQLEDVALSSLQSLRVLHAPLILATAEGRELQEQADLMRMTRDEQSALRRDAAALSSSLEQSDNLIEQEASDIVNDAVTSIGQGRHPNRGTTFGIVTIKHTAIVLVGAAVIGIPAHYIGGVVGAGLTMGAWEAVKKAPSFAAATAALGDEFNRIIERGGAAAEEQVARLAPFRRFVLDNEAPLRRIAASTTQLGWMTAYIDFLVQTADRPPYTNQP